MSLFKLVHKRYILWYCMDQPPETWSFAVVPLTPLVAEGGVNHLAPCTTLAYFLFQPSLRGVCSVFLWPSLHLFSYPLPIFSPLTAPLAHSASCPSCLPLPPWTSGLPPQSPLPPLCLTWFMWRLVFFQSDTLSLTRRSASPGMLRGGCWSRR